MPYFLYRGQHVSRDIPELLDQCRRDYPQVTIEVLPTLEGDGALEDIVVDRLSPLGEALENPRAVTPQADVAG